MPTVGQIAARRAIATIDLGDGVVVTAEFFPDRVSPAMMRQFSNLSKMSQNTTEEQMLDGVDSIASMLSTLLASWDLTESDDGPMVALTKERLVELGLPFLMVVFRHIWEAVQLGERTGMPSKRHLNGTSHRKAR